MVGRCQSCSLPLSVLARRRDFLRSAPRRRSPFPQSGRPEAAVRPENAFLEAAAGWFNVSTNGLVSPPPTPTT